MDTLNTMISEFDSLELSQKQYFYEIIKNKLQISSEEKLLNRSIEVEDNFTLGKVKSGNLSELFKDLDD